MGFNKSKGNNMQQDERTIIVHSQGSTFKYGPLYKRYFWEENTSGRLDIIEMVRGAEHIVAAFNKWDYLLIE